MKARAFPHLQKSNPPTFALGPRNDKCFLREKVNGIKKKSHLTFPRKQIGFGYGIFNGILKKSPPQKNYL